MQFWIDLTGEVVGSAITLGALILDGDHVTVSGKARIGSKVTVAAHGKLTLQITELWRDKKGAVSFSAVVSDVGLNVKLPVPASKCSCDGRLLSNGKLELHISRPRFKRVQKTGGDAGVKKFLETVEYTGLVVATGRTFLDGIRYGKIKDSVHLEVRKGDTTARIARSKGEKRWRLYSTTRID